MYVYTYNIASKTCFDQSPGATRVAAKSAGVQRLDPDAVSPPFAPEIHRFLDTLRVLSMDLTRAAVDAVVASPLFKLAMCVLYAFGPEDIKASSPGNIALREELAKDGSSAESIEVTIIVMRGMCIGWGVVEIALSLFGATLLMKVCRYFIPVEY